MTRRSPLVVILILSGALFASLLIALISGPAGLSLDKIFAGLTGNADVTISTIIWQVRMPRIIIAAMVGASLGVTGVVFQSLLRNPLADPYLIGVSSGGALGAITAISLGIGTIGAFSIVPLFAFVGALGATYLAYRLAKFGSVMSPASLLLAGIAIGSFLNAIIWLQMVFSSHDLQAMVFWLMGGLSARSWNHVWMIMPWFMTIPILGFFARDLNILLLGSDRATSLGVDVEWTKKLLLALASLIAASAVSVSGLIGFIGLAVPHMVRIVIGPDHRMLLPASLFVGACVLVLADAAARTLFGSIELPVGVVTAFVGAPFFVYLLRTSKRVYF